MTVAFLTLFLGLLAGPRDVELAVGDAVARVEIQLDGATVAVLDQPPWKHSVDFGAELLPHHLVAVAQDSSGAELGRAEQWINLPRPAAEAQILIADGVASLVWRAVGGAQPTAISMWFDDAPLVVEDPKHIPLPEHDPAQLHFLRADLRFSPTVEAVATAAFGGAFGAEVAAAMQAFAVRLAEEASPTPEDASKWLRQGDEPLPVRAVDAGPVDIVVVVDLAAQRALRQLRSSNVVQHARSGRRTTRRSTDPPGFTPQPGAYRSRGGTTERVPLPPILRNGDRVRFVTPLAVSGPQRDPMLLFPVSDSFTLEQGSLFQILSSAAMPAERAAEQRLADAVAVAGLQAYAGQRRRLVLLVVGQAPVDAGGYDLPAVRRYLEQLHVPLVVWRLDAKARKRGKASAGAMTSAELGPTRAVPSLKELKAALGELRTELDAQRILWVEGHRLPQQVEIGDGEGAPRWAGTMPRD